MSIDYQVSVFLGKASEENDLSMSFEITHYGPGTLWIRVHQDDESGIEVGFCVDRKQAEEIIKAIRLMADLSEQI